MKNIVILKVFYDQNGKDLIELHGYKIKTYKNMTYINILNIISINDYDLVSTYLDEDKKLL
jgi:hypothetical protein